MVKFIVILFVILNVGIVQAEVKTVNLFEREAANAAKIFSLKSSFYDQERPIIVHTPADYDEHPNKRYPVIYLLDGKRKIKSLIYATNILALKHKMPQVIIVAITTAKLREQDYSPNYVAMKSKVGNGKADNFTDFLKTELVPYIDKNYRTYPYRIISGHSRGGIFVVNDFLRGHGLFEAHIAFSPSLYMSDYIIIDKLAKKLQSGKSGKGFLYANAGSKENENILTSLAKLHQVLTRFADQKIIWSAKVADHETHGTTPYIGHYQALRKLFSNWDNPGKVYSKEGFDTYKPQMDLLSKEFGYAVIPDEDQLEGVGYYLMNRKKDLKTAIKAFKLNVHYHPNSANAYSSLAEGLQAQGLIKEAIKAIDKAVSLLRPAEPFYKAIVELQAQLHKARP